MKITELYIYPIKSLAPLSVPRTRLRREGLEHDRRFMLLKVVPGGEGYKNVQTAYMPECVLFQQQLAGAEIVVTYQVSSPPLIPEVPEQRTALRVPLSPKLEGRDVVDVILGGSRTAAYRMGDPYDQWFTACFGYEVILVYIGDQGRDVLAHRPSEHRLWRQPTTQDQQQEGWLSRITAYIPGAGNAMRGGGTNGLQGKDVNNNRIEQLTFNECAPFLLTSKASLRDVSRRLPDGDEMDMRRFRPNIVVDDDDTRLKAWEEDYWAEVSVARESGADNEGYRLALTANCGRCISINIDYETGRMSEGELGKVLKKLMVDRRVDEGTKYTPIFGRYAFLAPGEIGSGSEHDEGVEVAVGDEVHVTRRLDYRDTWAWPKH
ncbi:hypothetical protein F5Y19DRAFT_298858 [Xylariaceae sp. FL1651]|nr:hypothetical protein F5Y19DRAFT_298858 [Xylariaceae sp. FL1651]